MKNRFFSIIKLVTFVTFTIVALNTFLLNDNERYILLYKNKYKTNSIREWVVNSNVTQYSTYVIKQEHDVVHIETFIVLSKEFESSKIEHEQYLKCLYKDVDSRPPQISNVISFKKISFMPIDNFAKSLWRVKCEYKGANLVGNEIRVAVTDNYNNLKSKHTQYQLANIVDTTKTQRKDAIAHCVHMLRNVEGDRTQRLINWIDMQKRIGISVISLYIYDVSNEVLRVIRDKYSEDFVKIILHPTKFEHVCRQEIDDFIKYPGVEEYERLYNTCKSAYEYHFDIKRDLVANQHERINTNDCLFNYKYSYKYVSTYDIDEIILPRKFNLDYKFNNEIDCGASSALKELKYNIYDYAESLFKRFNDEKPTCLHFENVMFLPVNKNMLNFTAQLLASTLNKTGEIRLHHDSSDPDNYLTYNLNEAYVDGIKKKAELGLCLSLNNRTNTQHLDPIWTKMFASLMNMRNGKSIFSTLFTEGINQHYSHVPHTQCKRVPINNGYCSHYRESLNQFFIKQTYPIDYFMIDIEYYFFIENNF